MEKIHEIRKEVAAILTKHFGDESQGIVFKPEDTIKRSGAGEKFTKYMLKTSVSWTAEAKAAIPILVHCVGMPMTEFIEQYKKGRFCYIHEKILDLPLITIYSDTPLWKTSGYVKAIDSKNRTITLHILDLFDSVTVPVCDRTPHWLIDEEGGIVSFTCKIHQGWRSLRNFEKLDWTKVWKTFKFSGFITSEEAELF